VFTVADMQREHPNWDSLLNDGLHLSEEGNTFVFNKIMATIKQDIPEIHPSSLQPLLPEWKTINP
jgi:hypothetical protein